MTHPHLAVCPRVGRRTAAVLLALVLTICNAASAESQLKHGVVWYSTTNDTQLLARAAAR